MHRPRSWADGARTGSRPGGRITGESVRRQGELLIFRGGRSVSCRGGDLRSRRQVGRAVATDPSATGRSLGCCGRHAGPRRARCGHPRIARVRCRFGSIRSSPLQGRSLPGPSCLPQGCASLEPARACGRGPFVIGSWLSTRCGRIRVRGWSRGPVVFRPAHLEGPMSGDRKSRSRSGRPDVSRVACRDGRSRDGQRPARRADPETSACRDPHVPRGTRATVAGMQVRP